MLFYLAKDISYSQIGIINLLTYSFCLISEIPVGYLADRYGNKKILIMGMCIKVVSLSLLLTNDIFLFFVAAVLSGIETAFSSGADEALLYNHFEYNKVTDRYKGYLGKLNSITYFFIAISTLFSPILLEYDVNYILYASICFSVLSLFFLSKVDEVQYKDSTVENTDEKKSIKSVLLKLSKSKEFLYLMIANIVFTFVVSNMNMYTQPFIIDRGMPMKLIGIFALACSLVMAFGSRISDKCKKRLLPIFVVYMLSLICLVFLDSLYLSIALFLILRMINGLFWPIINPRIQSSIDSEYRATILSIKSAVISVVFIISDPIFGAIADKFGINYLYLSVVVILLVFVVICSVFRNARND